MYLEHFGLSCPPFALSPDPRFFYGSSQHRIALTMLQYAISSGTDICLLSGAIGCGKTTLVRSLVEHLDIGAVVGMITGTHAAFGGITDWVVDAFELGEPPVSGSAAYRQFIGFVERLRSRGQRALLIVDESQNLSDDDLDALRVLTNVNAAGRHYLQVILVGQPEIRERLKHPKFRQLVQRIAIDHDLKPLERGDTENYLRHRIRQAGGRPEIFTMQAIDRVHGYSQGVPRVINMLADFSLLFAFADRQRCVGVATVEEVVAQKSSEGLFWSGAVPTLLKEIEL